MFCVVSRASRSWFPERTRLSDVRTRSGNVRNVGPCGCRLSWRISQEALELVRHLLMGGSGSCCFFSRVSDTRFSFEGTVVLLVAIVITSLIRNNTIGVVICKMGGNNGTIC